VLVLVLVRPVELHLLLLLRLRLALLLGQAVVAGRLVLQPQRRPQPLHLHLQPAVPRRPGRLLLRLARLALLLC
jgi:hypothetical protein